MPPDGTRIAIGHEYRDLIHIRDVVTGKLLKTLETSHNRLLVRFSPDGSKLAAGGDVSSVKIWRVSDLDEAPYISVPKGPVHALTFSPDGPYLACSYRDDPIKIWNVRKGSLEKELTAWISTVDSLDFSPDGTYLAASSRRSVELWNVRKGKRITLT